MSEYFEYDVFLSYSSKDTAVVRDLAERLRADGVKVWFDEWMIKPGDSIPSMIERGLETSRTLVLCMSKNAFASDWSRLESYTFRFRDPLNKSRRFIPLRLDDQEAPGSLAQFLYVDWRGTNATDRDAEYKKFLTSVGGHGTPKTAPPQVASRAVSLGHTAAVRGVAWSEDGKRVLSGSTDNTVRIWNVETGQCVKVLEGHKSAVWSVAWSEDGKRVLSGSGDNTVRIWNVETGQCVQVLEGHRRTVISVAWSEDGKRALSGSEDSTVRVWNVETGQCLQVLEGHKHALYSVAWSEDGKRALSGGADSTVRVWNVETGQCLQVLEGHAGFVYSVAWSEDGKLALSGGEDSTVRVWNVETGQCVQVLEGHKDFVYSVAWSEDGKRALSGSADHTVGIWDVEIGQCVQVLEGHTSLVYSVAWSEDGKRALSGSEDSTVRVWNVETGQCLQVLEGHTSLVYSVAWSEDGKRALSGSADNTVRVWNVETGQCVQVLEGHRSTVISVAWSEDGKRALSGSADNTVRVWNVETGQCVQILEGHEDSVFSVAWSEDGKRALSGSADNTVRVWNVETGQCVQVLEGHTDGVHSVAWSPDGRLVLSGSDDFTVRVWDAKTAQCLHVLEGHRATVSSVDWSPDGGLVLSGTYDFTVRVWDAKTGQCLHVMEGHTDGVTSVAWSPDGSLVLSGSDDDTVRVWDAKTAQCLHVFVGPTSGVNSVAWGAENLVALSGTYTGVLRIWDFQAGTRTTDHASNDSGAPAQVQYTNAKVLLVGDSSAGKTGLSKRLASGTWEPSDSTVGAWATQWKLDASKADGVTREIWLWDFGGQADQRLIHQLYMEETSLAVLVFDGQREDFFDSLSQWDRDLHRASRKAFKKLLAAGRVDAGGLRVSRAQVEKFASEKEFCGFIETSAKENRGCDELRTAIWEGIDWDAIPCRTTDRIFKLLKDEIIRLKDEGRVLMRINELRDSLQLRMSEPVEEDDLRAVLTLLAGPGVVIELAFGSFVLLQPERINAYAQAVIRTLQADEYERGFLKEEAVLAGELNYSASMERLSDPEEERFTLLAMHQTLVSRALCFRLQSDKGTVLVFPSYFRKDRPDMIEHPSVLVNYHFTGFLDEIYATLVVRLHHTTAFDQSQLWRNAADFRTSTKKQVGIKLNRRGPGEGDLQVYFEADVPKEERILFSRYVQEHLERHALNVTRFRHYICENCGTSVGNRDVARERLEEWIKTREGGRPTIICAKCEQRIALWDELEEYFLSPTLNEIIRDLEREADVVLDAESKERVLVGEVISTVALAAQISRELTVSDHGIDMEIEFKDDKHRATAAKVYLQLKSGDSYLYERVSDGEEVFRIKENRHAEYWMNHAYPVFLVHRSSEGEVRWMRIDDYLRRESDNGKKEVKQIVFEGERLDVMSVRQWRDKLLADRKKS